MTKGTMLLPGANKNSTILLHSNVYYNSTEGLAAENIYYIYPKPYRSGVCFSPSGKYVYVTDIDYLYQIEVDSDPQNPVIHNYGSLFTSYNNWPVGVGHMHTGPDCRMYISPSSSINMMHVIHQPDLPGEEAELQAHIPIPKRFSSDFPNIPNLFGSCDDTIEWGIKTTALYPTLSDELVVLYPNPAEHETTVTLPAGQKGDLLVYTQNGAPLHRVEIEGHQTDIKLDVSAWPSGMYIIQIRTQEGVASGKLVVR